MQFFEDPLRLRTVSLGRNFAELDPGMYVHAPDIMVSENNTQLLVCQYFGCYYYNEDSYLFNTVSCTFGGEGKKLCKFLYINCG